MPAKTGVLKPCENCHQPAPYLWPAPGQQPPWLCTACDEKRPHFKGGNVTLKCGGTGPDDYVFRSVSPKGRWHKIVLPVRDGKQVYEQNKVAMTFVLRHRTTPDRLCLGDAQRILACRTDMPEMTFLEFARTFGGEVFGSWFAARCCPECGTVDPEPWEIDLNDPPAWACGQDPQRCEFCGSWLDE